MAAAIPLRSSNGESLHQVMGWCHQLSPSSGTVPRVDTPSSPMDLKEFRVTPIQGKHPEVGGTVCSSPQ